MEPDSVLTALAEGLRWGEHGASVRSAIRESLTAASETAQPAVHDDDALRLATKEVLDGQAGTYVRSHDGKTELVSVADGRVTLRLSGACMHCPAAGVTMGRMLESKIRARYPGLIEVRRS